VATLAGSESTYLATHEFWYLRPGSVNSVSFQADRDTTSSKMVKTSRYREKARELREAAAIASNDHARKQFTILARQYEELATTLESMTAP
jgi:hypothetical protein